MHMARPPAWAPISARLQCQDRPTHSCQWAVARLTEVGAPTALPLQVPLAGGHCAHVVHSVKSLWPLSAAPTLSWPGFSHNLWCQWMGAKMYLLKPELLPTWFLCLPSSSRHRAVPLYPMGNLQALALLGLGMYIWRYGV